MNLNDIQNELLAQLQQPGITTFGSAPNFASVPSPAYAADRLTHYANEGYIRLMNDIAELELFVVKDQFLSAASTFSYNIPNTANYPQIAMVLRVMYQPVGLTYNYEFQQGINFVQWELYQQQTGYGYYQQLSFGTQPRICTVSVDRTQLWFYPGSAQSGDTIQNYYAPLPTAGALLCPTLVAGTDVPVLPSDCHKAIVFWALCELWINAREIQMAQYMRSLYDQEVKRIKELYLKRGKGDTFSIQFPTYPLPLGMEP